VSKLLIFFPNQASRAVALSHGKRHLIGRRSTNDIVLLDALVSGVHAALYETDAGWFVEDLGSRNGTWVNRRRVQSSVLLPQDTLRIGQCTARLLLALNTNAPKEGVIVGQAGAEVTEFGLTRPMQDG